MSKFWLHIEFVDCGCPRGVIPGYGTSRRAGLEPWPWGSQWMVIRGLDGSRRTKQQGGLLRTLLGGVHVDGVTMSVTPAA